MTELFPTLEALGKISRLLLMAHTANQIARNEIFAWTNWVLQPRATWLSRNEGCLSHWTVWGRHAVARLVSRA
jgi:hypothetical protein